MVVYASGHPNENQAVYDRRLKTIPIEKHEYDTTWRELFTYTDDVHPSYDEAIDAYLQHPTLVNALSLSRAAPTKTFTWSPQIAPGQRGGTGGISDLWQPFAITDGLHDIYGFLKKRPSYEEWFWSTQKLVPRTNPSRTHEDYTMAMSAQWLRASQVAGNRSSSWLSSSKGPWSNLSVWKDILEHIKTKHGKMVVDGVLSHLSRNNYSGSKTLSTLGILSLIQMIAPHLELKELTFIDRSVWRLDPSPFVGFLKKYTADIYERTGVVVRITDGNRQPVPKYLPINYDAQAQTIERPPFKVDVKNYTMDVRRNPANPMSLLAITMPFTKNTLDSLFHNLASQPDYKDYLTFACELNFFRDMFHADVALQSDVAFVTQDRLAYTAYSIFAERLGLPNRGFFALEFAEGAWCFAFRAM
jgi:hypothetical protein